MNTISRESLQSLLARGEPLTLLEALPERHHARGHLPGAKQLPQDQVAELAGELIPSKTSPVVVYCSSDTCRNSHQAAEQLTTLGYSDVRVYAGGKQDWEGAGLPLERGGGGT